MKLMIQIGIVFLVCLAGQGISLLLPFPFPASVLAMVLLFLLLITKVVHPHYIHQKADFLLQNMAFFFIPSGVTIIEYWEFVKGTWLSLLLICIITTVLTFLAASYTVLGVTRLLTRQKGAKL